MIVPKYSLEIEHEVLETLMDLADPNHTLVQKALLKLTPDCFYNVDNRRIYCMIRQCFDAMETFHFIDIMTLIERHNPQLHEALIWMIENYNKCHVGEAKFDPYVDKLIMLKRLRKQIDLSNQMIREVTECPNPEEAQSIVVNSIQEISSLSFQESKHGTSNIDLSELYYDGKLQADLIHPTTCQQLNEALDGGIIAKSFITIGAAPGVGKTGLAIFLMDAIARAQPETQALFFSLEMESKHIWMRQVGVCAGKQFDKLTDDERMKAVTKVMQVPVRIYDPANCHSASDIDFILTTSRICAMDKKISVIVVDYLGLVTSTGRFESNALKQNEITSKLAQLALQLDCIVIALSQINRAPSSRPTDDRCPYPSDASGSSGSHFSSTLWLGVDRPELYHPDPCYRNQFVIKCRKNRFGGLFELILAFNDGTFAEVPYGAFRKPYAAPKCAEKAVFSSNG